MFRCFLFCFCCFITKYCCRHWTSFCAATADWTEMERRDPVVMTTLEVLKPPTTTFISDSPFDFTYYIALLAFKTQKYEKMTTTKIFSFSVLGLEQEHRQKSGVLRSKYFTLLSINLFHLIHYKIFLWSWQNTWTETWPTNLLLYLYYWKYTPQSSHSKEGTRSPPDWRHTWDQPGGKNQKKRNIILRSGSPKWLRTKWLSSEGFVRWGEVISCAEQVLQYTYMLLNTLSGAWA